MISIMFTRFSNEKMATLTLRLRSLVMGSAHCLTEGIIGRKLRELENVKGFRRYKKVLWMDG